MGGSSAPPPVQANYSEALADSLRAQVDLLRGTGDFQDTGGLAELLRDYEAPVRQQTAQIDTDVLRQTLLGSERKFQVEQDPETGKFGITGAEVVKNEQGEPQTAGNGRYQIIKIEDGFDYTPQSESRSVKGAFLGFIAEKPGQSPTYSILDTKTGGISGSFNTPINNQDEASSALEKTLADAAKELNSLQNTIDTGGDEEVAKQFTFENPYTGKPLQEGETITIREGDGMVDLLGDRRNVQETRRLSQIEQGEEFVRQNPEFKALYDQVQTSGDSSNPFFGLTEAEAGRKVLADAGGDAEKIKETFGISNLSIPEFAAVDTGRQAGFDEQGNFLGSAALAEDIQAGQLSRQRERDIADVERLSGRFSNIMDDFKPATAQGLQGARDLLDTRQTQLQGDIITSPTALEKADYQMSGEAGLGQVNNQDTLRQALLGQAKSALDDGLTAREQRQIEQAARARQTATGRIFDPSSTIQEAQAVIEEDRNRQMQNRAFAQSALGQEAALQTGDVSRGMATDQFNVGSKMDAERLRESLRQSGLQNFIGGVGALAAIEDQGTLDPFQAILGRGGGGSLQAGQGVLGSASYGLQSGPQYLNPEAGLGYQSNLYTNQANMFAAQQAADASRQAGLLGGLGSFGGGVAQGLGAAGKLAMLCWVAREVYGPSNPQWLMFREWMFNESPKWFFNLYIEFGERFANWISNKPRIKSVIRKWMDSKIGV